MVAPGGGFVRLDYRSGGAAAVRRLAHRGVTTLVLKYCTTCSASDPIEILEVHWKELDALATR